MLTEHDVKKGAYSADYTGQVLVLKADRLAEPYQQPEFQLWKAFGGFGCNPTGFGRAVFVQCLADGEKTRFERYDFHGIATDEVLARFEEANV